MGHSAGDRGAEEFAAFYSAGFDRVYRASFAFSGSHEVAKDASQEAFSRAFVRWHRLRNQDWAAGWVMRTALNLCRRDRRDYLRRMRAVARQDRRENTTPVLGPDRIGLVVALRELPPRQRQAVVLHYVGDHSIATVAQLMGLSPGAVKAHLVRARRRLKEKLDVTVDEERLRTEVGGAP